MPSHDIITQMFQHIKGICSTVRELVEQVKVLASTTPPQTLLTPMISVTQPSNQWRIQGGGQEAMASPFGIKHASGPFGSLECSDVPKGGHGGPEGRPGYLRVPLVT